MPHASRLPVSAEPLASLLGQSNSVQEAARCTSRNVRSDWWGSRCTRYSLRSDRGESLAPKLRVARGGSSCRFAELQDQRRETRRSSAKGQPRFEAEISQHHITIAGVLNETCRSTCAQHLFD